MFSYFAPAFIVVWFLYAGSFVENKKLSKILTFITLIVSIIALLCYIDIMLYLISRAFFDKEWYAPFYA